MERHKAEHLPVALVTAAEAAEVRQALDVSQQLKAINGAALSVLRDARAAQDGDLALKAVDRIQRQIALQAKLLGDLDERPVVNVLLSPEWAQLRGQLVAALAPFPEARLPAPLHQACPGYPARLEEVRSRQESGPRRAVRAPLRVR